jgi:hypothetical protein
LLRVRERIPPIRESLFLDLALGFPLAEAARVLSGILLVVLLRAIERSGKLASRRKKPPAFSRFLKVRDRVRAAVF